MRRFYPTEELRIALQRKESGDFTADCTAAVHEQMDDDARWEFCLMWDEMRRKFEERVRRARLN